MLALLISMASYITFVVFAGAAAVRDASGNISDVVNSTVLPCTEDCHWGLFNSYSVSTCIQLQLLLLIAQHADIVYIYTVAQDNNDQQLDLSLSLL